MKKLIFLFLLLPLFGLAQETPPTGLKPVNAQFFILPSDSSIWHEKGTPYGWERLARYKDVKTLQKSKVDSVRLFGTILPGYQPLLGFTAANDANVIHNNITNIPESKRVSINDSLNTTKVAKSHVALTDTLRLTTPYVYWEFGGANPVLQTDNVGQGKMFLYWTYNSGSPYYQNPAIQFKSGGGAVAWSGSGNDSPGWMTRDFDYTGHKWSTYYFGGNSGTGRLGYMNSAPNYAFNWVTKGRDVIQWDSIGNVKIIQPTGRFTTYGAAGYNAGRNLLPYEYVYKQKADSLYLLGFTAENVANKSTSPSLGTSNILYPSQNAVKSYVDASIAAIPAPTTPTLQSVTTAGNTTTTAISAQQLSVSGTVGSGYIYLRSQGAIDPATPSAGLDLYAQGINTIAFKGVNGFSAGIVNNLTASRTYTLPDATTVLDGVDNIAVLTNKDLSSATNILPVNLRATTSPVQPQINLKQAKLYATFTAFNGTPAAGDSVQRVDEKLQYAIVNTLPAAIALKANTVTTTLGDVIARGATIDQRVAGNTTTVPKFLASTGNGTVSALPTFYDLFGGANTWTGMNTYMGTINGVSGTARGFYINNTLQETSNSENQYSLDIAGSTSNTGGSAVTSIAISNAGSGYVNGTYNNVPLTGGTGTGAVGNFIVSGGSVTVANVSSPGTGTGYTSGDVLSASNTNLGGSGSGLLLTTVIRFLPATIYSIRHLNGIIPVTANNIMLGTSALYYSRIYSGVTLTNNIQFLNTGFTWANTAGGVIGGIGNTSGDFSFGSSADAGYRMDITSATGTIGAFRSTGNVQNTQTNLIANLFNNTVTPIINNQTLIGVDFNFTFASGSTALSTGIVSASNYTISVVPTSAGSVSVGGTTNGSGTGAAFTVVTTVGGVTSITVTNGGSGYAIGNTVTLIANGGTIVYTIPSSGGIGLSGTNVLAARFGNAISITPVALKTTPLANSFEWFGDRFYSTTAAGVRIGFANLNDLPSYLRVSASGTGSATTITIAHGLTGITSSSKIFATAKTAAAAGWTTITTDATNITLTYSVAPASGTNNLTYDFEIKP